MVYYSSFEYSYLLLPLIGFTVGFLASVLGSGGGFFFLPALILIYNVPAHEAITTSLAATLPICIIGSLGHYRQNHIHLKVGLIFGIAGILGAIAGAGLSSKISSAHLKIGFGVYSILIAFQMMVSNWKIRKAKIVGSDNINLNGKQQMGRGSYYGFLAGLVTGTFGTSGAAPVLAGLFSMRLPLKIVAGTSLLIITATTISALGAHFLIGRIDLTLIYFLTSGAVIGAVTGPHFLARIKTDKAEGAVRNWYALGLIAFGILLIANNY